MKNLLSAPAKMALTDAENSIYQKSLSFIADLSLNLMAIKVSNHPEDFLGWCGELLSQCKHGINRDLLENEQLKPLEKLELLLATGVSISQLKMLRIAPWPVFLNFIEQKSELNALDERFRLLDYTKKLSDKALVELSENDTLAFAGKHMSKHSYLDYDFDIEWFASTKAAKVFHALLSQQPADFDLALNCIPLTGKVTSKQYQDFTRAYKAIFKNYTKDKSNGEKAPLAPATRLLAMRRPDQFVALTTAKIDALCQGLDIVKFNNFDFDNYWQELILTIRACSWWNEKQPKNEAELKIWQARAILVDLFLFTDEDSAKNSNYLRLRDKALNNPRQGTGKSRKSTKLSAEEQVDNALADEDLPEYMQGKRESIINSVKSGKTVEQVISLYRTIFG